MQSLAKQVKNRFNISDLLTKLLNRVFKLEQNSSGGSGGVTLPIGISDVTNLQTSLNNKQDTLVSGTNIKTINNSPLLGNGNINLIPLTGTTVGNPVSGDIEFNANIVLDDSVSSKTISSSSGNLIDFSSLGLYVSSPEIRMQQNSITIETSTFFITALSGEVYIDTGVGKGVVGLFDNSDNIDGVSYTQKNYVDGGPINYKFYLTEGITRGKWIDSKPIYRIVKLTLNPNPAGIETIILSRVVGSYTILEYTKV